MNDLRANEQVQTKPKRWDIPHLVKWILLILLFGLLAAEYRAGEYSDLADGFGGCAWFILLLKFILIIGLLVLMWIQRRLKCDITEPTGCTAETPDKNVGIVVVTVKGTASGAGFSHYTLEIQKGVEPPMTGLASYPGGGSNGNASVVNGVLGSINTSLLSDGAYTIILNVFGPSGAPCVKKRVFTLLKSAVWITRVGGSYPVTHKFDEGAELGDSSSVHSLGGPLRVAGSAYVYECDNRKVKTIDVRYAKIPSPAPADTPAQPANDTPIPGKWPVANQLHAPLEYTEVPLPSKYNPATRIGYLAASLLNNWQKKKFFMTEYWTLHPVSWNSRQATDGSDGMGGAKVSLLLTTEDTAGHRYFDTQLVWLDNWPVVCRIVKFQRKDGPNWVDLAPCTDILMSWKKLRIIGLAWDALIDKNFLPITGPNDNFDKYGLSYSKQFVGGSESIAIPLPNVRVPSTPVAGPLATNADAGILAEWDLTALDAEASPVEGTCPNPDGKPHKLHRGCECTYILTLSASDTTRTQSTAEHNKHNPTHKEALKIINDL